MILKLKDSLFSLFSISHYSVSSRLIVWRISFIDLKKNDKMGEKLGAIVIRKEKATCERVLILFLNWRYFLLL